MNCPICGGKTYVISARLRKEYFHRRRECEDCLTRFSTKEVIEYNTMGRYLKNKAMKRISNL